LEAASSNSNRVHSLRNGPALSKRLQHHGQNLRADKCRDSQHKSRVNRRSRKKHPHHRKQQRSSNPPHKQRPRQRLLPKHHQSPRPLLPPPNQPPPHRRKPRNTPQRSRKRPPLSPSQHPRNHPQRQHPQNRNHSQPNQNLPHRARIGPHQQQTASERSLGSWERRAVTLQRVNQQLRRRHRASSSRGRLPLRVRLILLRIFFTFA
jgi:hypothetical protein